MTRLRLFAWAVVLLLIPASPLSTRPAAQDAPRHRIRAVLDNGHVIVGSIQMPPGATVTGPVYSRPPAPPGASQAEPDLDDHVPVPGPVQRMMALSRLEADPGPSPVAETDFYSPQAASDLIIKRDNVLAGAPSGYTSSVAEPSVGSSGQAIFQSYNWYAAGSTDNGSTWSYVSPYTTFPATGSFSGGFCCDQRVTQDSARNLIVWNLQYVKTNATSSGTNGVRIAVAHGAADIASNTWQIHDFTPGDFGVTYGSGYWFDYPNLAVSSNYLYFTYNIFTTTTDTWAATVIGRVPLSALDSNTAFTLDTFVTTSCFTLAPVSGAANTMWFAAVKTATSIEVVKWPESATVPTLYDVSGLNATYFGTPICTAFDSTNPCGRGDTRVQTGWVTSTELGFAWASSQNAGAGRPYPFTRVAILDPNTPTTVMSQPDLWNASYAYMYPALAVNGRGHEGGAIDALGGSQGAGIASTMLALIRDDYSAGAWVALGVATSNAGTSSRWGDYNGAIFHQAYPNTWLIGGKVQVGGTANSNSQVHSTWVLRSRDDPALTAPAITTNPASTTVVAGQTATFTAAASGTPAPTAQWQVSVNGGASFSDIAGATATSYAFTTAPADTGKRFRAVFTNAAGAATTTAATLTVVRRPSGDFDGDGLADVAVYRPSTGTWYVRNQSSVQWGVQNDIPVMGDYNGDGTTDVAVFRPSTGTWYVRNQFTLQYGAAGDMPVPGDYDGDGTTDVAVYRPSTGTWYVRNQFTVQYGAAGDLPMPGDYNGDGLTDVAAYRPSTGTWYVRNQVTVQWGSPGDVPVPADYDGNQTTDVAVWRPSTGVWYVRNQFARQFGAPGDVPVVLDLDGDGRAELGVFRPAWGVWYHYNLATDTSTAVQYGAPGDTPLGVWPVMRHRPAGDLDGDGRADVTVFRPSSGTWFTALSSGGYATAVSRQWGASGDVPVPADYDGDRRMDLAVYRPVAGAWYVLRSTTNFTASQTVLWGASTDVPVPADYDGDGFADVAVYTPATGVWSVRLSSGGTRSWQWGTAGDTPVVGDYDGDGLADPAVYRPSAGYWFVLRSSTNFTGSQAWQWGVSGDEPVVGDFDGDGRADLTVFRPSSGVWFVAFSSTGYATGQSLQWGANGDTPVALDYDGDGAADLAVYRPATGTWYLRNQFWVQWGAVNDVPIGRRPQ